MLKRYGFENITKSKSAAGIEVIFLPEGGYEINLVVLKKSKSKLLTEKSKTGISNFEALATQINIKAPLVLILNGKGIIHKKVSVNENDTLQTLLSKVLPNANENEFAVQVQRTSLNESQAFISVIRLNTLHDLLDELKRNKITNIAGCYLGPFLIQHLLPLIDENENNELNIGNYQLQIREGRIEEVNNRQSTIDNLQSEISNQQSIIISGEKVESRTLPAFAGAFSYFAGDDKGINNSEIVNHLKEEYRQKRTFEFWTWVALLGTFFILTINYFIANNIGQKINELNKKLLLNQSALEEYEKLKTELDQKKGFLEQNGLLESSRTSYYADQLAATLPVSIQWTDLSIHPLKKKKVGEEQEGFFFENKIITISGKSQKSTELNDWMKEIRKEGWVKEVTLINYKQDNEKEKGEFLIQLQLK